jgi:hypothetical protein
MGGIATPFRDFLKNHSGSMTVEFVVLVPLLLAALAFSFEFGKALWAYDVATRDVRAAVRYLSRAPAGFTNQAKCLAMTGLPVGTPPTCSNNPKHFPWTGAASFPAIAPTNFSAGNFNQDGFVIAIEADVTVPVSFMSFLNAVTGAALDTSYTLRVSDNFRWIGS